MGQTLEEASKVAVVDFDSIEQMRTWLTYGPTAALERFIAMLRTALLMGDRVVVDRNQVLDGMCFLALGPSGVRHVLGLASHARLPVTIAVEPPGPSAAGEKPQDAATIDHQIARVSRAGFASSAAYAVEKRRHWGTTDPTGTSPSTSPGNPYADFDLLYGPAANAHEVDPTHEWWSFVAPLESDGVDLDELREAWADELRAGRVDVEWWPTLPVMSPAFWSYSRMKDLGPQATVLAHELRDRSLEPDRIGVANRRSVVLGWIADRVRGASAVDSTDAARTGRMAMKWWSLLYEDALQAAGGCPRIAFWNTTRAEDDDLDGVDAEEPEAEAEAEREWGLRKKPLGRVRRLVNRRARRLAPGGELRIEGSTVTAMQTIDHDDYRKLRRHPLVRAVNVNEHPTPRAWFDVALLVQETQADERTWGNRVAWTWARFVLFTLAGFLLAFKDTSLLPNTGWFVVLWAFVGLLAALPYGDLRELGRYRGGALTSTIRISEPVR